MELLIFAALAIGLLFFMSSRTRKQQQTQQSFRSSLAPGQEVMTASGLFGTVVAIDDENDVITLETEPGGSQTRWLRAAIAKRVDTDEVVEDETETDAVLGTADDAGIDLGKRDDSFDVPDDISGIDGPRRDDEGDKTK
ncbi:preprotein translocase subunit YajC [Sediminihabitans luteus]|uniref:Preprotein translocase subunit YajC n=1 Tax=Sediminihabitans luteus TaxID=1138585 RepID=A0A2M9CQN7_9CELL|nr:preprotein translocase subunit YajC [Sediminihabitans luteus]PJJ74158.1 preprotein translocase subunit YajC [Sediminihabitans luteus]GII99011.1 hypothetical protein Slu03_13890 [Sediminihabitans luteus]